MATMILSMRKTVLFIVLIAFTLLAKSQQFSYQVLFEGIGDNREYLHEYAHPQTILGTRSAFELGVDTENHHLRGGLSYLFEFGSDIDSQKPKLTLYYQFATKNSEFIFGAFPRKNKINFPLAMLTDTLLYYRPNIEGMFGKVDWEWGHQLGFVDWVSRQTNSKREQFMAGSSGEIVYKNLFAENFILMFHDANPAIRVPGNHLKDYLGFSVLAGIKTNPESPVQGKIKAGILNSMYRERNIQNGEIISSSFYSELYGRYKKFAIKSVLNAGGAHRFAYGDLFYRQKNYWRTDVYWHFIQYKNIEARFNLSFHVVNFEKLNQQQQLSVVYVFGK